MKIAAYAFAGALAFSAIAIEQPPGVCQDHALLQSGGIRLARAGNEANAQPCQEGCVCWSARAGGITCSARIMWVAGPHGPHTGDTEAAAALVFEEYPEVCTCATPPREETTMSSTAVPATTSVMLRSIGMTSYRRSGKGYPDPASWPSSCSVKVVDDKVCASVVGYANDVECGFIINEDGYISTVGPASFANSGDYVRLLGYSYNIPVPHRVAVTAGTPMDFHSDGFYPGGLITLCFEPQRSIEMTSYKRWGYPVADGSPAYWPSSCSVKTVDDKDCAIVQGYANAEDCGFTIKEAGYISTIGPHSFANSGDYVRLLGYAYNTPVPQRVSVTAGTPMDFHSDEGLAGGQITLCFEPEPFE